ncbi:hypothetical protein D3C71_2060520 [compost metagenome]
MQALLRREMTQHTLLAAAQVDQGTRTQAEGVTSLRIAAGAVVEQRIDTRQALDRLAQRPGRQATTIAQAARRIDQHQLQITGQTIML